MMYVGVIAIGLAYGGHFCLVPTMTSELFGIPHFGANWGFLGLAPALGSFLFSQTLAGRLADFFRSSGQICVKVKQGGSCTNQCWGPQCFEYTYLTTTGVCALCLICAVVLLVRQMRERRAGLGVN